MGRVVYGRKNKKGGCERRHRVFLESLCGRPPTFAWGEVVVLRVRIGVRIRRRLSKGWGGVGLGWGGGAVGSRVGGGSSLGGEVHSHRLYTEQGVAREPTPLLRQCLEEGADGGDAAEDP